MQTISTSSILIIDRQRKDLGNLDEDFSSIRDIGLIQPIVLEPFLQGFRLIAGGRRLAWLTGNGFTTLYHGVSCVPDKPGYILSSELTPIRRQEAELYENIKRQSLHWADECKAIASIHRARWIDNKAQALAWSQQHTARLLGIKANAKVTYALQIADELRQDPDGLLSKCEKYSDAVKMLIERNERSHRAEQEKRREILTKLEGNKEGNIQVVPRDSELFVTDEASNAEAPQESLTIWLSNMLYHGDFTTIAETDFPPDVYPCALVFYIYNKDWLKQTFRLLRADSFLIPAFFLGEVEEDLKVLNPVIWNVLDDELEEGQPFTRNIREIDILAKGNPRSPCPSKTCVVSANDTDEKWPPAPVLDFLLRATTIPGDSILMPCSGPVATILELGRRPICFDADEETHLKHMEEAKAYYNFLYLDNVTFK
jgi:hypothetical protein